ncbi:toxin CptA [Bathymodiolus japonicus methanotrophic gill symbiont]|nr:toxin CptA [Bathymodiolus japonicus methanotrophic gill symbiont]
MSKRSAAPLWVDVKQSRNLLAFIIIVHVLALLSSWLMPVAAILKVALCLLSVGSFYFYLQRYQQGFYSFSLRYSEELSWELVVNDHHSCLHVLRSTVLTSFIIILQVKIDSRQRSLLVCRDAVSAEEYRKLFVALKIMKLE